jgi:hypothetical protein
MLEVKDTSIAPDTQYGIDCMLDESLIDGGTALLLDLYGDRPTIDAIVDNKPIEGEGEEFLANLRESNLRIVRDALRLASYASTLAEQISDDKRAAIVSCGLANMQQIIHSDGEFLSSWAICDLVEGGCNEAYNDPPRCKIGDVWPFAKDKRRLYSPAWIRRYVKRCDHTIPRHRTLANIILSRASGLDPARIGGGIGIMRDIHNEATRRRRIRMDEQIARWNEDGQATEWRDDDGPVIRIKKSYLKELRRRQRQHKKILKRALPLAASVLGADRAKAFINGEPLLIEGQRLDFKVEKNFKAASAGHGALTLSVLDKSGADLAGLCFYFEGTPAIDQVTALALHAQAGEEETILEAANITHSTTAMLTHPAFEAKRVKRVDEVATLIHPRGRRWPRGLMLAGFDFREVARARDATYWQETQHHWLDAIGVQVMGVKGVKLMRANAEVTP